MQEGMHVVPESAFPSARQMKWIVAAMLVYFGARLFFFAISISPHVPPDEVTHFGKCEIFSNVFLLPVNSDSSHPFGLVTNIPWLYYWIMGKLLPLNFLGISDLTFLRLSNIPFAFGTIYFVRRILRLLTEDRFTDILLVAIITNTMMFSFLSASVSYDNLANLLATMAIYYLFAFFKERSATMLAASMLCQLLGSLTKNTFLPLIFVLGIVLILHEYRNLYTLPSALKAFLLSSGKPGLILVLAIVLGLVLNIQLYGGNYVRYQTLEPETYNVFPLEHAMEYRLAARNYIFTSYREGHITIDQATDMAGQIDHQGDREATISLVQNYAQLQQFGYQPIGPFFYTALWIRNMMESTFGIKAHLGMANSGLSFIPLAFILLLGAIAFLVKWRPNDAEKLPLHMLVIAVFYCFILVYKINYPAYLEYRDVVITVAGRYMFPVVGPVLVLFCYYLLKLFKDRKTRIVILGACVITFIACDFPFFLSKATSDWFILPL